MQLQRGDRIMKTKNHGFTLVELMVAIVISLVAVLAATEVYVSTRQTNRLQGMQSRLSEDGRFAVFMLQRFLSQAGFRPTPNIALPVAPNDPIVVANDVIAVRFAPDGENQIGCDGSVRPVDIVFQSFVIQRLGNSLQCTGLDSTANWIAPAAAGVVGNGTEVADFAVQLGVDTGPPNIAPDFGCGVVVGAFKPRDCIVDEYVDDLDAVNPPATSNQIKALRVCLVLRSEAIDGSVVKPTAVRNCANTADITGSQTDRKFYRTFWTTVLMKNLKDN
jgi:type IV pilus assembly protein PilW